MTIYKLTEQFKMFFHRHVISIKSMTLNFNINILLPCFFFTVHLVQFKVSPIYFNQGI